jgi:hypothetical protein
MAQITMQKFWILMVCCFCFLYGKAAAAAREKNRVSLNIFIASRAIFQ